MVSMKELLEDAKRLSYAVGAFNMTSITFVDAIIDAAVEQKSPVILSISERHVHKGFVHLEAASKYIKKRASQIDIPLALHLDHGETIEMTQRALDCGFNSVMIDRSNESFEKNIADTKTVVDMCKPRGISVEGELGAIGGKEGEGHINIADTSLFTDPKTASQYVEQTGLDSCLAVAIGNVHGRYAGEPNLDFDRLDEISKAVSLPLGLHGGSGISDDDFRKLIEHGIKKINFYFGNAEATYKSSERFLSQKPLENGVDVGQLFKEIYNSVKATTMKQMDIFGSSNKA